MAFLDPILNPVLQPLLNMSPFWAILLLSLIISLLITIVYKYFTNQEEMKRLKGEQKEYQKKMKGLKDNPQEMMKIQKEAMKKNMDYMKHSFKATLITMLPIILIFGWMNAHLAYEPIQPGDVFKVSALFEDDVYGEEAELIVDEKTEILSEPTQKIEEESTWRVRSKEGERFLTVRVGQEEQTRKVLVTEKIEYEEPISFYEDSAIKQIKVEHHKLRPLNELVKGNLKLFSWEPGWLGLYIIFSIVFSMGLRKILKIY